MKPITLTLFIISLFLPAYAQEYTPGTGAYQYTTVAEQSDNETSVSLAILYTGNMALIKVNNYSRPLHVELYSLAEKVVRNIYIDTKDQVTTLNLENLQDEYYYLRIHSEDGAINYVYKISQELAL